MFLVLLGAAACGDDDDGSTDAQRKGVGAACTDDMQCNDGQSCLTQFKGGYCGLEDCTADVDCPAGSACVTHDDGVNYCFLICQEKVDCNGALRPAEVEANCSSNIDFVDDTTPRKACVPPSGT
jgi:hypothetical protein